MAQWKYPAQRNEWTEQVKCDLDDFGLPDDLDILKNISINSCKVQVKKCKRVCILLIFRVKQNLTLKWKICSSLN